MLTKIFGEDFDFRFSLSELVWLIALLTELFFRTLFFMYLVSCNVVAEVGCRCDRASCRAEYVRVSIGYVGGSGGSAVHKAPQSPDGFQSGDLTRKTKLQLNSSGFLFAELA